jgi:hypothetical protein
VTVPGRIRFAFRIGFGALAEKAGLLGSLGKRWV